MKQHYTLLAKVLEWAFENEIKITIGTFKSPGLKDQIELTISKNGRSEYIRFLEFEQTDRVKIQNDIMEKAFNLCLTRLEIR